MILILKNSPPGSFVTYGRQVGAAFDVIDGNVKNDLKIALLHEQGWICGYCQQKISTEAKLKIEHFCEQSICNGENGTVDRRMIYTNLLAVCLGSVGDGQLHCDSKKATFNATNGLPISVCPWVKAHTDAVTYSSTGRLSSSNALHSSEIENILNLNIGYLKESRQKIWLKIFALATDRKHVVNKAKMKKLVENNFTKVGNEYPNSFPGLYQFMFNRFCK